MPKFEKAAAGADTGQGFASWKRWLPLGLLVVLMIVGFSLGWHRYLTLSSLIKHRATLFDLVRDNYLLAVAAFCLVYVAAVSLSFPGASLLTMVGGLLFGALAGGTITAFSATVGAAIVFIIARSSLGHALEERAGPLLSRISRGLREDAFSYLLFLRLTPIFPFWLVNVAPALVHVPLRTYVIATFVGIVPGTYAYAFLGSGLDSLIAAQEAANPGCVAQGSCSIDASALVTREMIFAFVALGVVALIPVATRKWRGRNGTRA